MAGSGGAVVARGFGAVGPNGPTYLGLEWDAQNGVYRKPQPHTPGLGDIPTLLPGVTGAAGGAGGAGAAGAAPAAAAPDPRIAQLTSALGENLNVKGPDYSSINARSTQLQNLMSAMMRGEGMDVGDLHNDPEARAFRIAKLRETELGRESEANRLAASGMTGSGDFDTRVAGLNEAAGTAIAGNEAALTGKRRSEKMGTAVTGAQLELNDLNRLTQNENERYRSDFEKASADRSSKQALLSALTGQSQFASSQSADQQRMDLQRQESQRNAILQQQQLAMELERFRSQQAAMDAAANARSH